MDFGGKSCTPCDWLHDAPSALSPGHDGRWASLSGEQRHIEQLNLSSISTQSHTPSPYVSPFTRFRISQLTSVVQMLSRSAMRMPTVANQIVARRGFSSTRMQLASPYHYPEGPRSNLPFNPLTKFFAIRYWSFMGESRTYRAVASSLKLTSFQPLVSSFPSVLPVNQSPQISPLPSSEYSQFKQSGRP